MRDTAYAITLPRYQKLLNGLSITEWGKKEADRIATQICAHQARYLEVQQKSGVPWQWVGAIHWMECGGNFDQHLANGDPITAPTVQVPKGIPAGTWVECAVRALALPGKDYTLDKPKDWADFKKWLWRAEEYNGWGYYQVREIESPYLWSGTNHYSRGKYTSDGKWDANARSQQVGVVPIWASLGLIKIADRSAFDESKKQGTTGDTAPMINLAVTTDTWVKSSTAQSIDSKSEPKVKVSGGTTLALACSPSTKDGHYEVNFIEPYMGIAKGYIWANHAALSKGGEDPDVVGVKQTAPPIDPKDKKAIQDHLVRIGVLDPPADGKVGSQTRSAIRAFNRVVHGDDQGDELTPTALAALPDFTGFKDLKFTPKVNDSEHAIAIKCLNRMVELGAHIAVSMGSSSPTYNLFHVTGTNPDGTKNSNKINHWNDLRFVVEVSRSGVVDVKLCKLATCEPGQHWIDNPMNENGTFRILFDKQWFAWSVGRHGSRQYPALCQVGEIQGYRDSDRDGSWSGEAETSGDYFGVNIHHGYGRPGDTPKTEKNPDGVGVGQMSAGCQVAFSIAGHEQFMELMKSDRRYICNNGYRFGNISLDGSKI